MPARTKSELVATMKRALDGYHARKPASLLDEMVQSGVICVVGKVRGEPVYDLAEAFADLRDLDLAA